MPDPVQTQATALRNYALGGGAAVDELLDLVRSLGLGLKSRIEVVEQGQEQHRQEVEQRLARYEEVQTRATDRMVSSVERLARLETIPDRLERIECDLDDMKKAQTAQGLQAAAGLAATNKRIDLVERQLEQEEAKQDGKEQTLRVFLGTVTWTLEHGWKLALLGTCAVVGAKTFNLLPTPPHTSVTNQQPMQSQVHAEDWPLRTN